MNKKGLVEVDVTTVPDSIRTEDLAAKVKRTRPYIDSCVKSKKLTGGIALGRKVIIKDEKYDAFVLSCKSLDKSRRLQSESSA